MYVGRDKTGKIIFYEFDNHYHFRFLIFFIYFFFLVLFSSENFQRRAEIGTNQCQTW